ncbi:MAG TPA: RNA methylase [bacterium]|jgi:site-specific DNA-methyltransferase (cytosine-N4-specific)
MTKHLELEWHGYKYFPYERDLAVREVTTLFSPVKMEERENSLSIHGDFDPTLVARLTYFSSGKSARRIYPTQQFLLESTGTIENGNASRRQNTRYSVHGIHEYKGKFNPQVVRGILNLLHITARNKVLDPFCGSGTVLVECAHLGIRADGQDLNPLAVFVANAKLIALSNPAADIERTSHSVMRAYASCRPRQSSSDSIAERTQYLQRWFDEPILDEIERLRAAILSKSGTFAPIFLCVASNLLRDYSLQEPSDLRIRRRFSAMPSTPFLSAYQERLQGLIRQLHAVQQIIGVRDHQCTVQLADSREVPDRTPSSPEMYDAAITSPPYATALPYIDTQRLSLVWLNLSSPKDLREHESALIGNREVTTATARSSMFEAMVVNDALLPDSVHQFCIDLQSKMKATDGFRRQAVPLLIYRYLADMKGMFRAVSERVRVGGTYALVVGRNHTMIGGTRTAIETPELLVEVAARSGWSCAEIIDLQTYHRYGLNRNNAVAEEALLILKRK